MTGGDVPPPSVPRRRRQRVPLQRRASSWLAWWVLLMGLWVAVDDNIGLAELVGGAAAAVLAALLSEVALHQASARISIRMRWLAGAYRLPGQVLGDTVLVFRALGRQVLRGEPPPSGFRELPVRAGDQDGEDQAPGDQGAAAVTRRVLLVGANSLAPNTVVLGIDAGRGVMVVHQLVVNEGRPQ